MKKHDVVGARIAGAAAVSVVAMTIATALPAAAQTETDEASNDVCAVVSMDNTRLLAVSAGVDRTRTVAIDIPAGEVSIPSARAWDAYDGRSETTPQTSERYEIEFIGADGSIVGVSAPTIDVPDSVESAEWIGSLGTLTLSAPAVGVRAHHRNDLPADFSPDSVNAGDFTVCYTPAADITVTVPVEPEPEPTTAVPTTAPTTAAPTTAPTTAAPTTAVDPAGPVAQAPSTTAVPATAAPTTAATSGQTLPVTGSETPWLVGTAGVLVAAGASLVAITRRRLDGLTGR